MELRLTKSLFSNIVSNIFLTMFSAFSSHNLVNCFSEILYSSEIVPSIIASLNSFKSSSTSDSSIETLSSISGELMICLNRVMSPFFITILPKSNFCSNVDRPALPIKFFNDKGLLASNVLR